MQTPQRKGPGTQGIQTCLLWGKSAKHCITVLPTDIKYEVYRETRFTFQFVCWVIQSAFGSLSQSGTLSRMPGTASHSDSSWNFFLPCKPPPHLLRQMTQQRPPQPDQCSGLRACCWGSRRQYDAHGEQPAVCAASLGSLPVCLFWLPCSEWAQHTDQEIYLLVGPQPWLVLLVPPAFFPVLRKAQRNDCIVLQFTVYKAIEIGYLTSSFSFCSSFLPFPYS